jgi:hypothetical protein
MKPPTLKKKIQKKELIIPDENDSIPKFKNDNISQWPRSFNQLLKEGSWTPRYFTECLNKLDPILATNLSILERFMLLLLGLNLKTCEEGILDFEYTAKLFGTSIIIVQEIFGHREGWLGAS